MTTYAITASLTFSNQTNRDAAESRVIAALAGLSYSDYTSTLGSGVGKPSANTMIISINADTEDSEEAATLGQAIFNALVAGTKHTSGYVAVNRI